MDDRWLSLVFLLAALILPLSALMGRRLAWRKSIQLALIWTAIFAAVAVFISAVRG